MSRWGRVEPVATRVPERQLAGWSPPVDLESLARECPILWQRTPAFGVLSSKGAVSAQPDTNEPRPR